MATISSPGIGSSNFDLSGLLTKLREYESKPLGVIEAAQKSTQTRISAYGTLSSAVTSVQAAAAKLGRAQTFGAVKVEVAGTTPGFTATAGAGAAPGQYTVKVVDLASTQVLQSGVHTDRKAAIGAGGTIDIVVDGKTKTVKVGEDSSLEGIARAINADDSAGARATIVNDGKGGSVLMLTAKSSGEKQSIERITVNGNDELAAVINYGTQPGSDTPASGLTQQSAGKNATLLVNDIEVTSASNAVTDVIEGITLNLTEAGKPATTVTLTADSSAAATAASEFVSSYNSLLSIIGGLTRYNQDTKSSSTLTADATTRNVQDALANATRFATSEGAVRSMGQIGITTDPKDGRLVLDNDKLNAALKSSPADVARIFSGPGGLSERVASATKEILGDGKAIKGAIPSRTEALTEVGKVQAKSLETTTTRIEDTMRNYETQFTALSKSLALFESTQNYLTQQFDMMAKQK